MRVCALFNLDSDLCLPEGSEPVVLNSPDNTYSLKLSNSQEQDDSVLSAELIFEADTLNNSIEASKQILAECLNFLTYTTNRKFSYKTLLRIVDWTPGLEERNSLVFQEKKMWDVAEAALDNVFINTAQHLLAAKSGEEQQSAMRWYRLAIQEENLEEQFSYFWFALEIVAETLKSPSKVPSKCSTHNEPLFCQKCDDYPRHRPFAREAINDIIKQVHPDNHEEVCNTLHLIRSTLMHGKRISSVLEKLPCNEHQAVNKLAYIAWQAIGLMFKPPETEPEEALTFGYTDDCVRRTLIGCIHMRIGMKGDPNNPQMSDFPKYEFEIS